jgi:hypothetical protein
VKEKVLKMRIRGLIKDEVKMQNRKKNLKMIRSDGKFVKED